MARRRLVEVVRYLRQLTTPERVSGLTDAELLERYVLYRDETAFELLLWRHGILVWNVCRRVLRREADAEDAFQATFLTFVRKAHVIVRRGAVASWLYKVAYRVALEAKERARKKAAREKPGGDSLAIQQPSDRLWEDIRLILDEELNRLPKRLRRPFVLCYLEGKTNEEAARQLGCPPGTIYSRLARGREMLRKRLLQRGVTLPTAALAAVLCRHVAEVAPTAPLVSTTLQAALLFASGRAGGSVTSQVLCLTEGVLRTMFLRKLKMAALVLLVVGLFAAGGAVTQHVSKAAPQLEVQKEAPPVISENDQKVEKKKAIVRVVQPAPGGLERTANVAGHVRAAALQQVFAAVSGYLKELTVKVGDRVKKGQVLAKIDAPLARIEEMQAAVTLELVQSQVEEGKTRFATAEADVQAARALVRQRRAEELKAIATHEFRAKELDRAEATNRITPGAIPMDVVLEKERLARAARDQVQVAAAGTALAEIDVTIKERKLAEVKAALQTAKISWKLAKVALEKARLQVGLTQVVSSCDGIVGERNYGIGDYISTSDQGARRPLMTIMEMDVVRVVVDVSERDVPLTHPGIPVDLQTPALPGVQFTGHKVSRIGFAVDERTGTMPVEIDVPNPKGLLRLGMFMSGTLHLAKASPNAFTVPESCVVRADDKASVYIVRDRKANRTPVRLGLHKEGKVEILEGVKASDLLVVDPKELSGDSVPVEVKKMP